MPDFSSRQHACLMGAWIGDALAMPGHWYYDLFSLSRDYGRIDGYLAPRNPHPDSILWRSSYKAPNKKGEILHDQAQYWGQRGVHYHQFLAAGENTLTIQLCRLLVDSLNERGGYDPDDWLARYVAFMTTPGSHKDTYVEECHRAFFSNYAKGISLDRCGRTDEKHIGGLAYIVPVAAWYAQDPIAAQEHALTQLSLTHGGGKMAEAAKAVLALLVALFQEQTMAQALETARQQSSNPHLHQPYETWQGLTDEELVWRVLSPACYVEYSVPATIALALRYEQDPAAGLLANANLAGDSCHRGIVLGALLGARHGMEGLPEALVQGLASPPPAFIKHET